MSQPSDLDVCRTLLDIIDEMNEDRSQPIEEVDFSDSPRAVRQTKAMVRATQPDTRGKIGCPDCKGLGYHGRWEGDGPYPNKSNPCETCGGTGMVADPNPINMRNEPDWKRPSAEGVQEAMSDAYGTTTEDQGVEDGSVEFKQHKNTDKGSVTIEASADNMEELQKIMQLAGLSLPSLNAPDGGEEVEVEVEPDVEPEEDVIISKDDSPCACSDCGQDPCVCGDPEDAEKQQTKQTLVNIIKDKLQQRLK